MTDVDIVVATAEEARALTARIRSAVAGVWPLLAEAYGTRAWEALGYASWDEYTAAEFDGARIRIPLGERRQVVAGLRETGMSTRAIGSALGVSYATVQRDLEPTDTNVSVAPEREENEPDRPREEPTVTGVNGKTYAAKSKAKRPRQPLPGQFTAASGDLSRLVARFERLATDDRYRSNREAIAELCTPEIRRAVQVLDELLRDLAQEENN